MDQGGREGREGEVEKRMKRNVREGTEFHGHVNSIALYHTLIHA